jgi:transcriptional regulator with XRE-family HTH domain
MPRILKFDFPRFYRALNERRAARGASWRQVAREVGIGKSTLARMAQDKRPDADGLAALAAWAELNPGEYVVKVTDAAPTTLAIRTDSRPSA